MYVLTNSLFATKGSRQKKLSLPMQQIYKVDWWITKKLMVMQAEIFNQLLVDKLFDDNKNERPQTSYIYISFFLVSFFNLCLANYPCLAENVSLAFYALLTTYALLS